MDSERKKGIFFEKSFNKQLFTVRCSLLIKLLKKDVFLALQQAFLIMLTYKQILMSNKQIVMNQVRNIISLHTAGVCIQSIVSSPSAGIISLLPEKRKTFSQGNISEMTLLRNDK